MAANKPSSCSPISSTRPNPSARNSETKDPMRRSFTGNPFNKPSSIVTNSRLGFNPNTPANSPSDFSRSSISRESIGSLRDFADKENSKDTNLNTARVRSPASASKVTKNFMSPTISAASKFTPSPRKKILVEKNDPVRSSVSFSDARSQVKEDNDTKPAISSSKKKTVSFSDVKTMITEDDDFLKLEMGLEQNKIEASCDSTITDLLKSISEMEDDDFLKPDMGLNQNKIEASHDLTITDLDEEAFKSTVSDSEGLLDLKKNNMCSLPDNATEENDCVNLDPTFKISPRTSCSTSSPMLAPLDADPLMPPYDPKTNYLSPRPQFLHYRPNRRIELIRNKDGKQLEESFVSETLSDSEVSGILSDDSRKESEDVSSDETVKDEEGDTVAEEEAELSISEPNPISTHKSKEIVQAKGVSKSKFLARSKFIAFLLVLVFAGLSISLIESPDTDLSVLKDLDLSNLYVPPEITDFVKVSCEGLAQRSQLWAANSFSYICKLISVLKDLDLSNLYGTPEITEFVKVNCEGLAQRSQLWAANSFSYICKLISDLRGVPKLGPLQFSNLTDLFLEDQLVDDCLKFGHRDAGAEYNYEENILAPIRKRDIGVEPLEERDPEVETGETIEEVLEEENSSSFEEQVQQEIDEVLEHHNDPEPEEECLTLPVAEVKHSEAEQTQESVQSDDYNDINPQSYLDVTHQPVVISEVTEIQPQTEARKSQAESIMNSYAGTESTVAEVNESQVDRDMNSYAEIELTRAENIPQSSELDTPMDHPQISATEDTRVNGSEDYFLTTNVVGTSVLVLVSLLAATTFFNYTKKGKPLTPNATIPVDQPAMAKKLNYSPISFTSEHTLRERPSSRNWQTEVDVVGESCPSEMSSFQSSSSSKKGLKGSSEAQSQERKPRKNYRRESLASSEFSMGSPSYGSFTTYEKLPSKHGYVDDEVVTPVRRSSRLRSQVTSP